VDLRPIEVARTLAARDVAEVMPKVLSGLGLDRKRSEAAVCRAWNQLIDPTLTAHAQPTGLVRGTLFVGVDSHVWLSEIVRYRRHEILERLQHCFGKELVSKISFRVQ
jgi:predicted nucleic acid-binding Zn ribbon protein